jgi:hypothetical protein
MVARTKEITNYKLKIRGALSLESTISDCGLKIGPAGRSNSLRALEIPGIPETEFGDLGLGVRNPASCNSIASRAESAIFNPKSGIDVTGWAGGTHNPQPRQAGGRAGGIFNLQFSICNGQPG